MTLSFNSFVGIDSPRTTKPKGRVNQKEVILMIDSGASHNFVSPEVVTRLQLKVTVDKKQELLLGNGVTIRALGVCKAVPIQLQSAEFISDFTVLELGAVDIILGVLWLETLGRCEADWKLQEFSFIYQGRQIMLHGDPELHNNNASLKSMTSVLAEHKHEEAVVLSPTEGSSSSISLNEGVADLLKQFSEVFEIPTTFPPIRGT